jgi:bifunctional UDP-N-acetylglucosamine pyrophosphorylase/glucosamine-1-phosphate N-acetyltransferase
VILASGRGTRFGADRPKVLAEVFGRPAIEWVLETLNRMPSMLPAVIVASDYRGADRMLRSALDGRYPVQYVIEANPHGTGHSVLQTESLLAGFAGTVLVTEGTQAMMQPATLAKSLLIHEAVALASMTIPTTRKQQPYAYLVRNEAGHVVDSRETRLEHAEPIPEGEDNVSLYLVRSEDLFPALHLARERCLDPATGHYHLGQMGFPNEMVRSFQRQGRLVLGLCLADEREAQSIKYPEDVVKIEQHLRELGTVPPSGQAPARTDALADPLAGT